MFNCPVILNIYSKESLWNYCKDIHTYIAFCCIFQSTSKSFHSFFPACNDEKWLTEMGSGYDPSKLMMAHVKDTTAAPIIILSHSLSNRLCILFLFFWPVPIRIRILTLIFRGYLLGLCLSHEIVTHRNSFHIFGLCYSLLFRQGRRVLQEIVTHRNSGHFLKLCIPLGHLYRRLHLRKQFLCLMMFLSV